MPEEIQKRSLWLGIAQHVVSLIIGVAIAAFFLGGARQRVTQKVTTLEDWRTAFEKEWKEEKQHITSMDLEGSVATKNFIQNYNKKQSEQDETMKEVQKKVGHLENMQWRIENLEWLLGERKKASKDNKDDDPKP